jgi:Uma2 family endonuclease
MTLQIEQPPWQTTAGIPTEPIHRLTVAQYHEMIKGGILTPDSPVELLEGWLIEKMSKNPPHRIATKQLLRALEKLVPKGWYVDSQEPITTIDSEPEPDAMVARGDTVDYRDRHPGPNEIALIAEISDASLARDRAIKKRVYARAGITTYWIVNLSDRRLEVYTDPTGPIDRPDYRTRRDVAENDSVSLVLDRREVGRIALRDVLP